MLKSVLLQSVLAGALYFGPKLLKNRNGGGSVGVPIAPMPVVPSSPAIAVGGGGLGYMQSSETGSISPYSPSIQTAFRARSRAALVPGRQKILI